MLDVCSFQVIGEMKDDPGLLLLVGDDGQMYSYDVIRGDITPLEVDDSWAVDVRFPLKNHAPATVDHQVMS